MKLEDVCKLAEQYGIARLKCAEFEVEFAGQLVPVGEDVDEVPAQGTPKYKSALERLAGTARDDERGQA